MKRALKEEPFSGAYLDSLGWIYLKQNKLSDAETTLRKALEHESHDATIHSHLGDLYAKTGRPEMAAGEWEKSLTEWKRSLPADIETDKIAEAGKEISSVQASRGAEIRRTRGQATISRMREVRIPSFAKINLRLDILGQTRRRLPRTAHHFSNHFPAR